jgi:small subunit ribosomal protein S12
MVTFNQLKRKKQNRLGKPVRNFRPTLCSCPQKKGLVSRLVIEKPKKPNSARRKIAKIIVISTQRKARVTVPGPSTTHDLRPYSRVLIRGGRTRDLIGLKYRVIPGIYDCRVNKSRRTSRSKYGVRRKMV